MKAGRLTRNWEGFALALPLRAGPKGWPVVAERRGEDPFP